MSRVVLLDETPLDLERAGISRFVHEASLASTMDLAHALADQGAPSGTVVVADVQHAGRGRGGKVWHSAAGDGLWFTLLVRDAPTSGLDVLSLRLGLAIADVVSPWCDGAIGLKWPNDVLLHPSPAARHARVSQWRKLAGVLVEARWRDAQIEWIAVGIGLNLRAPAAEVAAGALRDGVPRAEVLEALVPPLREAAQRAGALSEDELERWRARDLAPGRPCVAPAPGIVVGAQADGALRIAQADGSERAHRSGSLIFATEDVSC